MTDAIVTITREQKDRALDLMNEAMNRAGVITLRNGKVTTTDGTELGIVFFTSNTTLRGAGLDQVLGGMYGYGRGSDNGFYYISDITVFKSPDPVEPYNQDTDPDPEHDTVWKVDAERVVMTLTDGTKEAVSFTRVFASMAIAYAVEDGRKDDADLLEVWFKASAAEDVSGAGLVDNVPEVDTIAPHRHIIPNAKTSHVLTNPDLFSEGGVSLKVGGERRGQLMIDFGLSYDDDAPQALTELTAPIDREDVRVIAAVVTLKNAGNNVISPLQIAQSMGYNKPSRELQEEIHDRVMKLRQIDGRIDWTEQAKRYHITNPDTGEEFAKAEMTGHLVDANVFLGVDTSGNRYIRYQLLADPITYQHAKEIGQVVDYPQRLLMETRPVDQNGRRAKRMSREQTAVADTLLWFVHVLMNPKSRMDTTISYDKLFRRAGFVTEDTDAGQRSRRRMVKFVGDYLRALQQDGVILGYTVNTIGRQRKAVSVTVNVVKVSRRKSSR